MQNVYLFPMFDNIFDAKSLIIHREGYHDEIFTGIDFAIENFLEKYKFDISDIVWKVNTTGYHSDINLADIKAKDIKDFMEQFNNINPKFIEHEKDFEDEDITI